MDSISEARNLSTDTLGSSLILFIFVGLTLGQLTKHLCNTIKLPYTPVLVIVGMVVGAITEVMSDFGDGAEYISKIDPHTFFLVFLPPLIFESAFSIDWHIIKVELVQILILAGPWLLVASFLTALVVRFILGYDENFSFEAAIMFGALISATDPVAVVSLLKDLGASRTLSTMIEGESLFNDGTAYVMFSVTLELVKGKEFDGLEIFGKFWRLSFGGAFLGIMFGIIITIWLRRIINNSVLETNLTVLGAFLVFYTAEKTELEVSGILALVWLGLYMTKSGKTQISHNSEESLHHIWSFLGYNWETMVFLLAGVIISLKVFEEDHEIEWQDYFKLIALYIFLHIIRFGIIFALKWPMNKLGYGLDWREGIVLGYSGLRGAVSLSLALIVQLDHSVNHHVKDLVLFHTAGIAVLTLIINGTTMGFLVRILGLMRMSEVKKKMVRNLIRAYRKEVNETIENLKNKKNFGKVDWDRLKEISGGDKIKRKLFNKRKIIMHKSDMLGSKQMNDLNIIDNKEDYSNEELYMEAKYRYLTSLKGIYWEYFEQGQWSSKTALLLIESAARAIDHQDDAIKDFKFIESYFTRGWFDKIYVKLQRTWPFKYLIKNWLYQRLSFEYDAVVNYIEAHEECIEITEQIISNEEILDKLKEELKKQIRRAEVKLYKHLEDNFPEVIKAIQHRRGGYFLINHMNTFVEEMVKHGQMDDKEAQFFFHHLTKEAKKLTLGKLNIEFEHPDEDLMTHSQLSKIFSEDEIHELWKHFTEKHFDRNEVIIKRGSPLKYIYYISKGVIYEKAGEVQDVHCPKIKNRSGDLIGLQFFGKDSGISFTNWYAKSVCTWRLIPIAEFRKLIRTKEQEIKLWGYIGPSIIKLRQDQFSRFYELTEREVKALFDSCTYQIYKKDKKIDLSNGGLLMEGVIQKVLENDEEDSSIQFSDSEPEGEFGEEEKGLKYSYSLINPSNKKFIAKEETRIFHLPESLRDGLLALDEHVFLHAFHDLPKVAFLSKHHKVKKHYKKLKREKTTLIGIPKQLAHQDPVQMFRDKRQSLAFKFKRSNSRPLGKGSSNKSSWRDSIVPRGWRDTSSKVSGPNLSKGIFT